MERLELLRRQVPCLPMDLQEALEQVLEDDVVTDDERIDFLHALTGQPMDPRHKGVLREAIEYWAERDARRGGRDAASTDRVEQGGGRSDGQHVIMR